LNIILSLSLSKSLALLFQNVIALFAIPPIRLIRKRETIKNNTKARIVGNISFQNSSEVLSFTEISVFIFGFFNQRSLSESVVGRIAISLCIFLIPFSSIFSPLRVAIALFPSMSIS
jgi:hypothetical protein